MLLYDCDPIKHETVYFKYPFVMYETSIPLSIMNYFYNPLELSYMWTGGLMLGSLCFAAMPRFMYFFDSVYWPRRVYLLRGGRVLKFEGNTMFGTKRMFWVETAMCRPLAKDLQHFEGPEGEFLQEEGQLAHELHVQFDHIKIAGCNMQDQIFKLRKEGTVYQPELFEAALKGFNIDTSDFVINTADNERVFEGSHNT